MIFTKVDFDANVYIIDITKFEDERGLFARTVCLEEFSRNGLNAKFIQQSISYNPLVGTLRGMHWQSEPWAEEKLVRVTSGAIFDVIVDIRPESKTFKKWFSLEISAFNRRQLFIPKGFAHGFQVLKANTEVLYEMTVSYKPNSVRGFLWNDPSVGIKWPEVEKRIIGSRDLEFSNL